MSRVGLRVYGRIASSPRLFTLSQKLAAVGTRIVSPFFNVALDAGFHRLGL